MPSPTPECVFIDCPDPQGPRRMATWQWGDPQAAQVVICVHGLTRQGRDFDALAQALLARASAPLRVICPDVAGRGHSDWLADPQRYQLPTYAADMGALIATLAAPRIDWVGTSMGGLIGLVLASVPTLQARLQRLVLNDVGPHIEWAALARIGQYVGQSPIFDSEQAAAQALWAIASSFGPHTPAQWLALTRPCLKPLADGRCTLRYDPALAQPFKALTPESAQAAELALWAAYDAITCPTLLLRGAQSDLLSRDTALAMTQRGPKARLVEWGGVGHAPTLVDAAQSAVVADFLLGASAA